MEKIVIKGGLIYKKTSQVSTMVNDVISRIIVSDIDDFSEKVSAYDEYGNFKFDKTVEFQNVKFTGQKSDGAISQNDYYAESYAVLD